MKRMDRRWVKCALGIALSIAAVSAVSCGSHEPAATDGEIDSISGSVRLPLVTPSSEQFRLRGALFDISRSSGAPLITLDSDSDPGATALTATLDPGAYRIALRDGWSLEQLGDAGGPVSAALLTVNPLPFTVENARVTDLVYRFATDSGVVSFGSGELSVSVDVVDSAPSAPCSPLEPASCPSGQTCLFSGDDGRTFCSTSGSLPVGAPCSADQCVGGAQCLAIDPALPDARTCVQFCSIAADRLGCECRGLAFGDGVGVCVTPPPCTGPACSVDVLVAGAPGFEEYNADVRQSLIGTGAFASVDVFDAAQATPSVDELSLYDAVLVFSDSSFADANALGDNLAAYFDAGGRVVVATFANASVPLGGRWELEGFQLVDPIGQEQPFESAPLVLFEPDSPLVAGVSTLTASSAFRSNGLPINGGIVVAAWGSGAPLIVRGERNGRARVDLNMYPPSGNVREDFWFGDGAAIMRNALSFQ